MLSKLHKTLSEPIKKCLFWLVCRVKVGQTQKTIHIVRLDTIGDFVLFSATLPYFRKLYPDYKIVFIVDAVVKDLAYWFNEHNYFDELVAIDGKKYNRNFFYYYGMLRKIRLSAPEIVIQPTFSRTQKSDEVVLVSKEAVKIGYRGDLSNVNLADKTRNDAYYSRLIESPDSPSEPERNRHFLNELAGFEMLASGVPHWQIPEEAKVKMKKKLELMGINLAKPLIVICPGSSRSIKNWPVENFILLIKEIYEVLPGFRFILIGGPKEREICSSIQKSLGLYDAHNLCGKFTLPELAQTLSLAVLYVGNDTGAMHIASAVGVPVVGIMSGEHGKRFFPYPASNQEARNVAIFSKSEMGGVKNISVKEVFNEVSKLLSKIEK